MVSKYIGMMSSEEFEKLHEIYRSLYDELQSMPQRILRCHGEERKRLVRVFDERNGEVEEVVSKLTLNNFVL